MSVDTTAVNTSAAVAIEPLEPADVAAADRIMRQAFGTFLGLAQPAEFLGDASLVRPRSRLLHDSAWVARRDGDVVGSNFATRWGSFGFFGPLSVRPDLWDAGIGGRLMQPVERTFAESAVEHAGLFTWPHSPKHLGLYQRHDFWPHSLTVVMARPVGGGGAATPKLLSTTNGARTDALDRCREVSDGLLAGLDLSVEAQRTVDLQLGDVILVDGGFAICQHGAGTEAGSGTLYVKFGAVAAGDRAAARFAQLLEACDAYAARVAAQAVVLGVSTARAEAYRALLDAGFRVEMQGLAMHRGGHSLWSREGCWVVDDWR